MTDFVAEFGQSARGDVATAIKQIETTKAVGFTYAKWQAFDPKNLVGPSAKRYWDASLGGSETQLETFENNGMFKPAEWRTIAAECYSRDIRFLCTPFDLRSVDDLEAAGATAYKIASGDITYHQLLERVAETMRPIFLSTGAAYLREVEDALEIIGHKRVTLLACDLVYPCPVDKANLSRITTLKQFGGRVGYSDHTVFTHTSAIAVALGATVLEKHCSVTPGRHGVPDDRMALNRHQMREYVAWARGAEALLGAPQIVPSAAEEPARMEARRSLHWARDVAKGAMVMPDDIAILRPSGHFRPGEFYEVVGMTTDRDCTADTVVRPEDIL